MQKNTEINKIDTIEELTRARKELNILYNVSNAMRSSLDLDQVLHIILTGVTSHTGLGFNRAILFLFNSKDKCLEPKIAIGPESGEHAKRIWDYISQSKQNLDDLIQNDKIDQNTDQSALYQSIKKLKIPATPDTKDNLLAKSFNSGLPLIIPNENINEFKEDIFLQSFNTTELVIMPLKAKDKVNGVIVADNLFTQKAITSNDLQIFLMLANQAGLAIENAQLYELVKLRSHTDPVTNLWNHGFFQDILTEQIISHKKEDLQLSLIMVDIDGFKTFNDSFGHQNGDRILTEIANILKDSSRDNDYVCRYGGDEFSIILPQTNKDHCVPIAERIRQRVEQYNFSEFLYGKAFMITVSIGLATFPTDANDKEELIATADKAMYRAKSQGKNQVHTA